MGEKVIIDIEDPKLLAGKTITGERIKVGEAGDYKPWVAKLPGGELLLTAFRSEPDESGKKLREEILLFRSDDGGRTWSGPENLTVSKGLLGREPVLTVLSDGTILMTVLMLIQDVRNPSGYIRSYLHRSKDGGRTWQTIPAEPPGMGPGDFTTTTWSVLEFADGSLMLGVGAARPQQNYVWRSYDRGKTWPEQYPMEIAGLDPTYEEYPFCGEGVWWRLPSGKVCLVARIDHLFAPTDGDDDYRPEDHARHNDRYDRLVLYETTDRGRTLRAVRVMGDFGEMYPRLLRLRDGRLLYTFTVRALKELLGVRAVVGEESGNDICLDTAHDRIMLDSQTAPDVTSGGGFGPTVQLDDGTLVTSYSWRDAQHITHLEVIRWRLPAVWTAPHAS